MPWTRIDDNFYDHPKVEAAGPLGIAMFVCGLSYCARYLTDGFIQMSRAKRLIDVDDPLAVAEKLVEIGLWHRTDGGYLVHDYLEYNPSAEQVKADREANARRQAEYRARQADEPEPNGGNDDVSNDGSNGVTNGVTNTAPMPIPMPIPNPETEEEDAAGAAKPPTPPPKRSKTRQKKPTPEAVRVFRENAHRYPPKAWYADVERIVGAEQRALELWGRVVKAWVGQGWNPQNVRGMLDCYERREIPGNVNPPPQRPAADYAKHATPDLPPRETSHAESEWRRVADMLKGIMAADTFDHIFRGAEPQVDGDTLIVALAGEAQRQGYTRMEQNIGRCLQSLGVVVEFR